MSEQPRFEWARTNNFSFLKDRDRGPTKRAHVVHKQGMWRYALWGHGYYGPWSEPFVSRRECEATALVLVRLGEVS